MSLSPTYMSRRMSMIDVLIADDHAIVRRGLRTLIAGEPDMEVTGEAADGYEVVAQARNLNPDVILLDLVMPGQSGLDALSQIKADNPDARVLVLTSFGDNERVFSAIRAGATRPTRAPRVRPARGRANRGGVPHATESTWLRNTLASQS